jgi:hypothetical protein
MMPDMLTQHTIQTKTGAGNAVVWATAEIDDDWSQWEIVAIHAEACPSFDLCQVLSEEQIDLLVAEVEADYIKQCKEYEDGNY